MDSDQFPAELDIASLPHILNFSEEEAPLLERTHQRILETAQEDSIERAEAVTSTYHALAHAHVENQIETKHQGLPKPVRRRLQAKASLGILIKIAHIWHEIGVTEATLRHLDNAIRYARHMHWPSIITLLENEKQKLQSANT